MEKIEIKEISFSQFRKTQYITFKMLSFFFFSNRKLYLRKCEKIKYVELNEKYVEINTRVIRTGHF